MGRLLFATSWSPSLSNGTTSAFFHAAGKTEDNNERFTMSVKVGRILGRASLITNIGILSYPGALLDGKDITILRISWLETARNWNSSDLGMCSSQAGVDSGGRLYSLARDADACDALVPTEVKN